MADSALESSALDPEIVKAYKKVLNNSGLLKSAKVDFNDPGILKGLKTTPIPLAIDTTTGDDFYKANKLYLSNLARSLNKLSENELIALSLKSLGDDGAPLPVDGKWSPALATRLKLTMNTLERLDEETIKNIVATGAGREPTLADKFRLFSGSSPVLLIPQFLPLEALNQSVAEFLDMITGDSAEEKTEAAIADFNKSKEAFEKRFSSENLQLATQVNMGLDSPDVGNVIKDMAALLHKYNYLSDPNINDPYNKDFLDAYFKIIPNNTHLPNIGDGLADLTKKLPPLVRDRMELKHKFPNERVPAIQDIDTFKLKSLTNAIAESGAFPNTQGFDITVNPYHPLENGFLNSLAQIYISSNTLGLKEEEINNLDSLPEERRKQVEARIALDTELHNYVTKYPETGKDIEEALKLRMHALVEQPDVSAQSKADGETLTTDTGTERVHMAAAEDETPTAILPDDDTALSSLALQAAALYPIPFAAKILRTQYSFGDHGSTLNDVIYDLNTQQKVADFIEDTFERYASSERSSAGPNDNMLRHLIIGSGQNVKTYEIALDPNKDDYGHIYEVSKKQNGEIKRANRVADLKDKESLFAQAQNPHGAILAMMDAYGDKHVTPAADKEAERVRLTQAIIQRSGHPDIADELQQKLRSKSIEEFKQGELYRKLKSGYGDDSDFDSHIIALWNLENFYQSSASGNEISPEYIEQYKSVYGLLDLMFTGKDYDPDQHKKFRNSLNVEIGLLAHKDAYAILRMRGAVDPRLVYGEGNVPEKYKNKPMSKADVAQYVRNKMEDRAAELGIPINKISEAMMGLYKNSDGKTIHFMQNLEDQRLVFETLEKPAIDDHAVWQKIAYLANSNTLPPLDFLVNRMTDDQAKDILGISREALVSGYDDNGKRLQDFDRRELTGKLMAGSILHDDKNTNIHDAVMNYYESYMGRHANYRAPEWNTLYGQPKDLPLWAYMRVNWASLEKEYDGLLGDGRDHDYTQKLDDVREKLAGRPELLYKLESELEAYKDYDIVRFNELESYRHGSYGERRDLYIRQQEDMQIQVARAASATPATAPGT
ncbi:MAG: hypothetical protein KDJ75_00725 [Alphaproteobacteria bacterium]|nr:hypothetical protein [Alphaproteobacteria bacterium]